MSVSLTENPSWDTVPLQLPSAKQKKHAPKTKVPRATACRGSLCATGLALAEPADARPSSSRCLIDFEEVAFRRGHQRLVAGDRYTPGRRVDVIVASAGWDRNDSPAVVWPCCRRCVCPLFSSVDLLRKVKRNRKGKHSASPHSRIVVGTACLTSHRCVETTSSTSPNLGWTVVKRPFFRLTL